MFESGELAELVGAEQPEGAAARQRRRRPQTRSRARRCSSADPRPSSRPEIQAAAAGAFGRVLADLEGGAAAAGGDDVRVVDHEAGALEAVHVVDLGAEHELHADLVDDHRDALVLEDVVLVLRLVKASAYWKPEQPPPRTATRSACSSALLVGSRAAP